MLFRKEVAAKTFRLAGSVITTDIIKEDVSKFSTNWLLIENRSEEENVEACARIHVDSNEAVVVDLFAYSKDHGSEFAYQLKCFLLCKIETIARSLSAISIIFEVVQFHEEIQDWLEKCGYVNESGQLLQQAEIERMLIVHPCILLKYKASSKVIPYYYFLYFSPV